MYLSDTDILLALEAKKLTLSDFDEKRLGPASYDILL
jgi:deoxycytidine triphosphate deaminase